MDIVEELRKAQSNFKREADDADDYHSLEFALSAAWKMYHAIDRAIEAMGRAETPRMHTAQFKRLGRDLYCDVECTCLDPAFAKSQVSHLFKRKLKLTGYDDNGFFDIANAGLSHVPCKCGRVLEYQWTREGVMYRWIDD
jgi:hypothetical protein